MSDVVARGKILQLYPESKTKFFSPSQCYVFEFIFGKDGKAEKMKVLAERMTLIATCE